MRSFFLLFLCCFGSPFLFGQTQTQAISSYTPTEAYDNIYSTTLHDDENTTVYLIFVKEGVRKHLHQYHTEVITILSGRGRMFMGGEYFTVQKGDHIVVPPNTPHGVITTSGQPLQVISVQTPQFEGKDRVWLEKELSTEAAKAATPADKPKKKKRKKKKRKNDIPEFEGEFD